MLVFVGQGCFFFFLPVPQPIGASVDSGHALGAAEEILAAVESISIRGNSVPGASGKKETEWEFKGRRFFC